MWTPALISKRGKSDFAPDQKGGPRITRIKKGKPSATIREIRGKPQNPCLGPNAVVESAHHLTPLLQGGPLRHTPVKLLLAFAFLLFTLPAYAAETRGVKRVEIKTQTGESVRLYEQSHALVIGVSDYTNGWPKLPGVRKDVKAVTAALETHGFNVEVVEDAKDYMALDQA
ncbi:MAG TPA: caspase family protein, partial [Deltaproteobacteria bacterium]|nr:caspase family protein [Deltaproteobacteria bacterium]